MGKVVAVCSGQRRMQPKHDVGAGELTSAGLAGDVGTGTPGASVTLLALELIERIGRQLRIAVGPGDFGENLTVEGVAVSALQPGDHLRVGDAVIEVVSVGRPDAFVHLGHYQGIVLLPQHGVYARVVTGGHVAAGDPVERLAR